MNEFCVSKQLNHAHTQKWSSWFRKWTWNWFLNEKKGSFPMDCITCVPLCFLFFLLLFHYRCLLKIPFNYWVNSWMFSILIDWLICWASIKLLEILCKFKHVFKQRKNQSSQQTIKQRNNSYNYTTPNNLIVNVSISNGNGHCLVLSQCLLDC